MVSTRSSPARQSRASSRNESATACSHDGVPGALSARCEGGVNVATDSGVLGMRKLSCRQAQSASATRRDLFIVCYQQQRGAMLSIELEHQIDDLDAGG